MGKLKNEVAAVLVHVIRGEGDAESIIAAKRYKGKEVKALMMSIVRKSLKLSNPSRVLADAIQEAIVAREELRDRTNPIFNAIYVRENLRWSENEVWGTENTFFPTFKEAWNKAGGDPEKCSNLLGRNDWGELIMTPADCMKQYGNAVKEMKEHGLTNMLESVRLRKGRAPTDMGEVADAVLKMLV